MLRYVFAMLAAITFTLWGIFILIPRILSAQMDPVLIVTLVIWIVPLFPTVHGLLQNEQPAKGWPWITNLAGSYLVHLLELTLDLALIVFSLPLIAVNILGAVLAPVFLAVMLIGLGGWSLQLLTPVNLGIQITHADAGLYGLISLGLSMIILLYQLLRKIKTRFETGLFDLLMNIKQKLRLFIKRIYFNAPE